MNRAVKSYWVQTFRIPVLNCMHIKYHFPYCWKIRSARCQSLHWVWTTLDLMKFWLQSKCALMRWQNLSKLFLRCALPCSSGQLDPNSSMVQWAQECRLHVGLRMQVLIDLETDFHSVYIILYDEEIGHDFFNIYHYCNEFKANEMCCNVSASVFGKILVEWGFKVDPHHRNCAKSGHWNHLFGTDTLHVNVNVGIKCWYEMHPCPVFNANFCQPRYYPTFKWVQDTSRVFEFVWNNVWSMVQYTGAHCKSFWSFLVLLQYVLQCFSYVPARAQYVLQLL